MHRKRLLNVANYLLLSIVALLFISPIFFMVAGSLKPEARVLSEMGTLRSLLPGEIELNNYRDVFARIPFGRYLWNSALINGLIVGLGLIVNALAAYALARLQWPGRDTLLMVLLALLIIPFEAIAVPLFYQLSALGWRNDYLVQVFPFVANPLAIYLFYSFFLGLPRELEEAACVDGAGILRTFFSIIIPNARPVFATVAIVTFLLYWGMYLWPLLMTVDDGVRPLPLAIATFYTLPPVQWGDILAFGVMMVLPVLVIFIAFQPWFVRGVATTGLKG
jgi:multiple sugar transport system permease protein